MTNPTNFKVVLVKQAQEQLFRCLACNDIVTGGYNLATSEFVNYADSDIQCPNCFSSDTLLQIATYSIEAGLHNGENHFDHHGAFSTFPAPCNNPNIPNISNIASYTMKFTKDCELRDTIYEEGGVIQVSHLDADTLLGVMRLLGLSLPSLDLELMEKIDLNGSSVCDNIYDQTRLYMVGISEYSRELKFPRVSDQIQDVSDYIYHLLLIPEDLIIERGLVSTQKSEATYANCLKQGGDIVGDLKYGFWSIGSSDPLDPSRPYQDNYSIVVVYRSHFKTVSIYCNPAVSSISDVRGSFGGYQFAGHPKAAGSPRGIEITEADAFRIYNDVVCTTW